MAAGRRVCFQVTAWLHMDRNGKRWVSVRTTSPDGVDNTAPDLHEVLGVLDMAKDEVKRRYAEWEEDEEDEEG